MLNQLSIEGIRPFSPLSQMGRGDRYFVSEGRKTNLFGVEPDLLFFYLLSKNSF